MMQTFLPYPDFKMSMQCLDNKRLGNQVYREGKTLINGGWKNHPASKMWRGYERALALYCLAGLDELENRGRSYPQHREDFIDKLNSLPDNGMPPWIGDPRLHSSHRANLLRKDAEWYGQFGWKETPREGYFWPR